jgi:hypothetical protein
MWFKPPERYTLCPLKLYCCVCKLIVTCVKLVPFGGCPIPFIAQGLGSYIKTWGPTCSPEVVDTLYNTRVLMARCSN